LADQNKTIFLSGLIKILGGALINLFLFHLLCELRVEFHVYQKVKYVNFTKKCQKSSSSEWLQIVRIHERLAHFQNALLMPFEYLFFQ